MKKPNENHDKYYYNDTFLSELVVNFAIVEFIMVVIASINGFFFFHVLMSVFNKSKVCTTNNLLPYIYAV